MHFETIEQCKVKLFASLRQLPFRRGSMYVCVSSNCSLPETVQSALIKQIGNANKCDTHLVTTDIITDCVIIACPDKDYFQLWRPRAQDRQSLTTSSSTQTRPINE